jgi:hypothetical protein
MEARREFPLLRWSVSGLSEPVFPAGVHHEKGDVDMAGEPGKNPQVVWRQGGDAEDRDPRRQQRRVKVRRLDFFFKHLQEAGPVINRPVGVLAQTFFQGAVQVGLPGMFSRDGGGRLPFQDHVGPVEAVLVKKVGYLCCKSVKREVIAGFEIGPDQAVTGLRHYLRQDSHQVPEGQVFRKGGLCRDIGE